MKSDKIYLLFILIIILTTISWFTSCTHQADISGIPEICFGGEVLPIFTNNCAITGCHNGSGGRESRLALNNYSDISNYVVAGNPDASRLYKAIIAKAGENMMPPKQPLSLANRTIIRVWIEQGAKLTVCSDTTGTGGGTNYVNPRACFTRDILPVLVSRCATTGCHDAVTHREGYNYTSYSTTMTTVSAGNPDNSRLYQAITTTSGESKMPKGGSFSVCRIRQFEIWVNNGFLNN
jgi:hypothetical protein